MPSLSNINVRSRRIAVATKAAVLSTLRPLQRHHYTLYDLQYLFVLSILSFCFYIIQKPLWFKLPIALSAIALLIPRRTRQFLLPFSAIAAWLILFYSCRFIPSEWRPHIFTSVLPALENILYGGNISEVLAESTTPLKDLLAWMPYGVLHFALPFVTAALVYIFSPPGALPVFARTFGYMNLAGVFTQLFFPCAPPWYETSYGALEPATYSMPGSPGGLARVDDILGLNMYKTTFTASPLVFGAFPSLHSGSAWVLAFFLVYIFGPRVIPVVATYVFWIWWATMYLGHHYVVDLVGGAAYAVVAFWIGSFFLPSVLPQHHNLKAAHVIHDLGDAMNHQEKQTLFDAAHDNDDFVGFSKNMEDDDQDIPHYYINGESQDLEIVEEDLAAVVVVKVETEIEEEKLVQSSSSVPTSPVSSVSSKSKKATFRQSWNGWHGYEAWMDVLVAVNSPRASPHTSPTSSPRDSISHGHAYHSNSRSRMSRESVRSTGSVTTLDLDQEANAAMVRGPTMPSKRGSVMSISSISSSLTTIEEDASSSSSSSSGHLHGLPSNAIAKGRARPSRLVLEQSSFKNSFSVSLPSSPATTELTVVDTDSESNHSSSSSRPTSPRSVIMGSPSPALGKRFKDD